jgi:hypothetical protein
MIARVVVKPAADLLSFGIETARDNVAGITLLGHRGSVPDDLLGALHHLRAAIDCHQKLLGSRVDAPALGGTQIQGVISRAQTEWIGGTAALLQMATCVPSGATGLVLVKALPFLAMPLVPVKVQVALLG